MSFLWLRGLCSRLLRKSSIMTILERLFGKSQQRTDAVAWNSVNDRMNVNVERSSQLRIAVADTMAQLQSLDKPDDIKDCS